MGFVCRALRWGEHPVSKSFVRSSCAVATALLSVVERTVCPFDDLLPGEEVGNVLPGDRDISERERDHFCRTRRGMGDGLGFDLTAQPLCGEGGAFLTGFG